MTMRILHVIESLVPDAGAAAIGLKGLTEALRAVGIECATVSREGVSGFASSQAPDSKEPSVRPSLAADLVEQADIVHLHGWRYALARTAARVSHRKGIPYLVAPHGSLCDGAYNTRGWCDTVRAWFGENRLVRRAAAVAAVNEFEEHRLRIGHVHENTVRLPYGLTVSEYDALPRPAEVHPGSKASESDAGRPEPRHGASSGEATAKPPQAIEQRRLLLMLGPIHPLEGIVPLLKAFAEIGLAADGWNVALVGREIGNWKKMLEAAVRRKGGEGRVLFASAADPAAQRWWLSRASVLAAPSLHIRCPISLMQAAAAGVPVIASRFLALGALEDSIRLCEPTQSDVAAALRHVFDLSDEQRTELGRRAQDACRASLDWPLLVDRYVGLYESVVRTGRR